MIAEANAVSKLNLYLKVTARRPDRYHDLETLFLPLTSPADRIVIDFDAAPGIRVAPRSPTPTPPECAPRGRSTSKSGFR